MTMELEVDSYNGQISSDYGNVVYTLECKQLTLICDSVLNAFLS